MLKYIFAFWCRVDQLLVSAFWREASWLRQGLEYGTTVLATNIKFSAQPLQKNGISLLNLGLDDRKYMILKSLRTICDVSGVSSFLVAP